MSLRGPACPDSSLVAMSYAALDASLLIQSFLQLDPAISVAACARLGFLYALSVLSVANMGSFPFVHNVVCLDLSPSVLDHAHLGLSLSLQSFSCPESAPACFKPASGSFLFVSFLSHLDATSLSRGSVYLDLFLPMFDLAILEPSLLARAYAWLGLLLPPIAKCRIGILFLVAGLSQLGFSLVLHSLSRLGPPTSCVQPLSLDSLLPLKRSSHPGLFTVTMRACKLDSTSLATDFAKLEAPLPPQGFGRISSRLFVLDDKFLEASPLVRRFAQKELILLSTGSAHTNLATSVLSFSNSDLTSLLRSLA